VGLERDDVGDGEGWVEAAAEAAQGANEGEGGEGEAAVAAAAQLAVWHGTGRSRQDSEWHVLPWRRFERDSAWSAHYK
jgi:hypothetical protein